MPEGLSSQHRREAIVRWAETLQAHDENDVFVNGKFHCRRHDIYLTARAFSLLTVALGCLPVGFDLPPSWVTVDIRSNEGSALQRRYVDSSEFVSVAFEPYEIPTELDSESGDEEVVHA